MSNGDTGDKPMSCHALATTIARYLVHLSVLNDARAF